jgi:hypothetical protein
MSSASINLYKGHLRATADWLLRSIDAGGGGSSAYVSPISGWSSPYPETTGYIIPTLIEAAKFFEDSRLATAACDAGKWLLSLQNADGSWPGGLHKAGSINSPSVFNTAQCIDGFVALAAGDSDGKWCESAWRAARWLANGVDDSGCWAEGNYRSGINPSYYTQVARPMLQVWQLTGDVNIRSSAERVLRRVVALRTQQGAIRGWGFEPGKPSFTHTIAYTLRGLLESAYLLDDWQSYGVPCEVALDRLARKAEFTQGRLPGAYYEDWRSVNWYSCLTGNVQVAICLLRIDARAPDLRLVNAAAKLVDYVCSTQRTNGGSYRTRGAVAGSAPAWGRYMFMRYPNWAAKYHADALMMLSNRLRGEGLL